MQNAIQRILTVSYTHLDVYKRQRLAIRDALTRIPGIHHILEVEDVPFTDMHDIFEKALVDVYKRQPVDYARCQGLRN